MGITSPLGAFIGWASCTYSKPVSEENVTAVLVLAESHTLSKLKIPLKQVVRIGSVGGHIPLYCIDFTYIVKFTNFRYFKNEAFNMNFCAKSIGTEK